MGKRKKIILTGFLERGSNFSLFFKEKNKGEE